MTEQNKKDFLDDLLRLMLKHNISLSHEDSGGAFVLRKFNRLDTLWVLEASIVENIDGSINFHTLHYNGGAHWTEVVEQGLIKQENPFE